MKFQTWRKKLPQASSDKKNQTSYKEARMRMATLETRRQQRQCLWTKNIFQLTIQNNQIVKKEGSYQTFKVSKKKKKYLPYTFSQGLPEDVLLQNMGVNRERRMRCRKRGTQTKGSPIDGEGTPPRHQLCSRPDLSSPESSGSDVCKKLKLGEYPFYLNSVRGDLCN